MSDLTTILKSIEDVKAGDDLGEVVTATRLNAIRNALYALAAGDNIRTSGGVLKKSFPTQVILRGSEADAPYPPPCELEMFDASTESGHFVGWSWGRIANRQPTGFNTQGMIEPLPVADDGEYHYFYGKCTVDPVTLNCTEGEIVEAAVDVANTATVVYYLRGTAKVVDDALTLSPPICGPVVLNLCDLLSYYPYV